MTAALFPAPTFALWTTVLSYHLEHYAGHPLADLPAYIERRCLAEWYARGWPARDVAERLAECRWPQRATLVRFYTDRRPREVLKALSERLTIERVM